MPSAGAGSIDVPVTVPPSDAARFSRIYFSANNTNYWTEVTQKPDQPTGGPTITCGCGTLTAANIRYPACGVGVYPGDGMLPTNRSAVIANMSSIGASSTYPLDYVGTTGGTEWDLNIHLLPPPGVYSISFYAIDAQGKLSQSVVCKLTVSGG